LKNEKEGFCIDGVEGNAFFSIHRFWIGEGEFFIFSLLPYECYDFLSFFLLLFSSDGASAGGVVYQEPRFMGCIGPAESKGENEIGFDNSMLFSSFFRFEYSNRLVKFLDVDE
jgi:hypothetical protein